MLICHSKCRGI